MATQEQRDGTLISASRLGYAPLVRHAISLGAHASAPLVPSPKGSYYDDISHPILALRLAVKSGNEEAFQLLVDNGASVDAFLACAEEINASPKGVGYEVKALLQLLSRPAKLSFLRRFCEDTKLPPLRQEHLQQCLAHAVRYSIATMKWAKDTVELLVSHGASMRDLQGAEVGDGCPVAMAILKGCPDMAEEMLRLGASIHGKDRPAGDDYAHACSSHIPIFAAASQMAHVGPDVVRRFLAWGANPAHIAPVTVRTRRKTDTVCWSKKLIIHRTPLPVHMYLACIDWHRETQPYPPLYGLRFWLDLAPVIEKGRVVCTDDMPYVTGMHCSLHFMLLNEYGPNRLALDDFYEVMKELEPQLTEMERLDVFENSSGTANQFEPTKGIALERWMSLFHVKFPDHWSMPHERG